MIARWIAAALVAVGVVLYAAVAVPMRRQAQVACLLYTSPSPRD